MSVYNFYGFVANFADQSIIISATFVIFLLLFDNIKIAWAWLLMMLTLIGTLVIVKIFGYAIEHNIPSFVHARSISAHAAAGGALYGMIVTFLTKSDKLSIKTCLTSVTLFAILFGTVKHLRHEHTVNEVIAGTVLALILTTLFVKFVNKHALNSLKLNRFALAFASLLVIGIFYGHVSNGEGYIHNIGIDIRERIRN